MLFLNRMASVALALSLLAAATAPVLAGPADVALLQKYAGNWKGNGTLVGPDPGKVACRMTLKPAGSKLTYTGRCTFDGASNGFSGSLSYNDSKSRYEASSAKGTMIGRKSGGGIVFDMSQADSTRGSVSSQMSLSGGAIKIDFKIVDKKTKAVTSAHIPFSKS